MLYNVLRTIHNLPEQNPFQFIVNFTPVLNALVFHYFHCLNFRPYWKNVAVQPFDNNKKNSSTLGALVKNCLVWKIR
jgi:hypothetical protein